MYILGLGLKSIILSFMIILTCIEKTYNYMIQNLKNQLTI